MRSEGYRVLLFLWLVDSTQPHNYPAQTFTHTSFTKINNTYYSYYQQALHTFNSYRYCMALALQMLTVAS